MRKFHILIIICITLAFICCKKDSQTTTTFAGTYTGTYTHTQGSIDSSSAIQITFSADRYSGSSNTPHFPSICEGNYGIQGDSISFGYDCALPMNYETNSYLSGRFALEIHGDSIIFYRAGGDFMYEGDFYMLKKQ